jgi:hypothetical protein
MTLKAHKWLFAGLSALMLLAAMYFGLGVVQAACLFEGERAVRNVHFWGSMMCIAIACSALFCFFAIRIATRSAK